MLVLQVILEVPVKALSELTPSLKLLVLLDKLDNSLIHISVGCIEDIDLVEVEGLHLLCKFDL